jgi:hypothetical protein
VERTLLSADFDFDFDRSDFDDHGFDGILNSPPTHEERPTRSLISDDSKKNTAQQA